jgi:hypothetical protein
MKVRSLLASLVLAVLALPAAAQDVAGKWSGNVDTPQGPFALTFDFAVMGAELTGALLNDFIGQIPISEGMVDGDAISFKLNIDMGPNGAMTINYTGVVDGDELTLTSTFEGAPPGDGPAEQMMTLTRAE